MSIYISLTCLLYVYNYFSLISLRCIRGVFESYSVRVCVWESVFMRVPNRKWGARVHAYPYPRRGGGSRHKIEAQKLIRGYFSKLSHSFAEFSGSFAEFSGSFPHAAEGGHVRSTCTQNMFIWDSWLFCGILGRVGYFSNNHGFAATHWNALQHTIYTE